MTSRIGGGGQIAFKQTHELKKITALMSFEVGTMLFDNCLTIIFLFETYFAVSWRWGSGRSQASISHSSHFP